MKESGRGNRLCGKRKKDMGKAKIEGIWKIEISVVGVRGPIWASTNSNAIPFPSLARSSVHPIEEEALSMARSI